ncbi:PTS sugar transporter subunit IIA [Paenibacillus sp.]|uniref:BglG family transcription antiterminator n=1 Tax=Paenibacillus sp. TaxID=58172 RepID=UPI0028393109|nr:PTS sugar transporter subunit IIA [Paenibacillus sp.]MDR0270489.1 PTS sugar transporter subunit IIA [Paenibacillus sp.]
MAVGTDLSRRMIYYYMDRLDCLFKQANLPPLTRVKGGGMSVTLKQANQMMKWSNEYEQDEYILTTNERRQVILMLLLVESRKWFLSDLMELTMVSRNTVIKDIQFIKKKLAQSEHGYMLNSDKKRGYYVDMDELSRRRKIYQFMQDFENMEQAYDFFMTEFIQSQEAIRAINHCESFHHFSLCIKKTETVLQKQYAEQDVRILARTSLIFLVRVLMGNEIHWPDNLKVLITDRLEYKAAQYLTELFSSYLNLAIPDEEAVFYGMLLLCMQKNTDSHYKSTSFEEIGDMTFMLIDYFEMVSGMHSKQRERLFENVQTHMKVLYYRHVFNLVMPTESLVYVVTQCKEIYMLTKKSLAHVSASSVFKRYYPSGLTDDETASLSLYFEESVLREQTQKAAHNIVIVSDYANVYNSLLLTHIKQLLPKSVILGVYTVKDASDFKPIVNYCITTDRTYVHASGETIYVNSILSNGDKDRILHIIKGRLMASNRREQLASLLDEPDISRDELIGRIEALYLSGRTETQSIEKVSLLTAWNPEHIFQLSRIVSFDEALDLLAAPLLRKNYIQASYVTEIRRQIVDESKWFFIYPKVLLLHTDYRYGSFKPGISMLHTATGLITEDDPFLEVELIILLSTDEKMTHVPLLFDLDKLMSSSFLSELAEGGSMETAFYRAMEVEED